MAAWALIADRTSGLDPGALALGHAAEEGHYEVVGLRARVDGSAHLRHPEPDAVVGEHGEGKPELVAVESTLGLADHFLGAMKQPTASPKDINEFLAGSPAPVRQRAPRRTKGD